MGQSVFELICVLSQLMDKLLKCISNIDFSLRKQAEKEAQEAQRKAKEAADLAAKEAAEQAKRDAEEAEELARKQKEDEVRRNIH